MGAETDNSNANAANAESAESDTGSADQQTAQEPESSFKVGGTFGVSYLVKTWDGEKANRNRLGDIIFDMFSVKADGHYKSLLLSAQYRVYSGYHMLHHGFIGYKFSDQAEFDIGVSQVPFGILPVASHNWFYNMTYYVGLEDDYDLGIRGKLTFGDLDVRLAFYKNDEGNYTGSSLASTRYAYDVVPSTPDELGYAGLMADSNNTESNQGNIRVAYNLKHGDLGSTEIGLSGQFGGLYNGDTDRNGYHWAAAAHLIGNYGPFNLQLQGAAYQYKPENPEGQSDTTVVMGAFDAAYFVASEGYVLAGGLSYTLPFKAGPLDMIQVYNDYSIVIKSEDGFENTQQNATGSLIVAGPIYTYIDFVLGYNQPWLGPGDTYGRALAEGTKNEDGESTAEWNGRFNINITYYF
ncbi:MAG: hypothetical protein MJE77_11235 [Proteobacteria bacterium]|nr:hypothetical protein [Pseudomonadota bacterium]